jgi:squalene-associated FAD-dependent desaturase
MGPRILVVGGGLAGMAAAVALESAGAAVTLLEARRVLGGRAGSFTDPQTGEILDNCQHVLLGCCTNLIDFYRRIGATDKIRFERTIRFATADGRRRGLTGTRGLPAPLHLGPAFARFGLLSVRERIAAGRAMMAVLQADFAKLADVPFGQWLDEHGQTPELVRKLYDPIVISGLNEQTRAASAAYALKIFRDALLVNSRGFLLGLPRCPLGELYDKLPVKDVRLGARLSELRFRGRKVVEAATQDGQTIPVDAVVMATNHHTLSQWIPPDLFAADKRFTGLDQLQSVPILGAHLWLDRPVLDVSHLALVDGPLQWLFRKDAEGRVVHGVISAARDWLNVPREQALKMFADQIGKMFPGVKLERGVIVIEKRATFSPLPGSDRLRPPQAPSEGGIENLFLAGDYTQTGWPATMEGAVRSGYLAAEAVLGNSGAFLVPDLPIQWPARSIRHFSSGRTTNMAAR